MGGWGATSSSSRSAGGLASAKSIDDVMAYAESIGITLNRDKFRRIDVEAAKSAVEGVEAVIKDYPELKGEIVVTVDDLGAGVYATASSFGTITLNSRHYGDANRFEMATATYTRSATTTHTPFGDVVGFHPDGTTITNVSSHEAGHVLNALLISKKYPDAAFSYEDMAAKASDWNKSTTATSVVGEACKRVKRTPYGKGKKNNDLIGSVSGYASRNRSETLAECVADYAANGSNANPLSVAVHDVITERLRS